MISVMLKTPAADTFYSLVLLSLNCYYYENFICIIDDGIGSCCFGFSKQLLARVI